MLDFFGAIGSAIMTPLYYAVSAILIGWHWVFDHIPGLSDGWTWVFAIMGLTVTIRTLLIPLFVKQIKSSRNMQVLQPQVRELQKKYGHDRQKLAEEQMKLFKETGTNPLASCLPIFLQMPVFFALFRVIDQAAKAPSDDLEQGVRGFFNVDYVTSLQNAEIFNARIADTFSQTDLIEVRILTGFLVVLMVALQFLTQRQLMAKNMPPDAMSGPYAQQQKMMLYILPFVFAISGFIFPVGVLIYWVTSNAWTMAQQFYVIRNNPSAGTPAFKAKQERDAKKGKTVTPDPLKEIEEPGATKPKRNQPKKQTRSQRNKKGGAQ